MPDPCQTHARPLPDLSTDGCFGCSTTVTYKNKSRYRQGGLLLESAPVHSVPIADLYDIDSAVMGLTD